MTTFKAAIQICGLSQTETAEYLGVSLSSVKDWTRGKGAPPPGVWQMMADLYLRIEAAADHAATLLTPDTMDRRVMNNITADDGPDPLPSGADYAAGAMALLLSLTDAN